MCVLKLICLKSLSVVKAYGFEFLTYLRLTSDVRLTIGLVTLRLTSDPAHPLLLVTSPGEPDH